MPERCARATVLQGELKVLLDVTQAVRGLFWTDSQKLCRTIECVCLYRTAPAAARHHLQVRPALRPRCPQLVQAVSLTHICYRSTHDPSESATASKRARLTVSRRRQRAALCAEKAEADRAANTAARRAAQQAARTSAPTPAERQQAQQAARTGMMSAGERMKQAMVWKAN